MKQMRFTLSQADNTEPETQQRPRRMRRVGLWLLMSVSLFIVAFTVALFVLIGRPLQLPTFVADRAEEVLASQFPQVEVSLGDISIVVEGNWHPRIRARNIVLREAKSSSAIELEEVDVTLSLTEVLRGQMAPKRVHLSGAFLSLRRLGDGAFNITLGEGASADPIDASTTLANLGPALETIFDQPGLALLDEVEIEALHLRYEDVRAGRGWTIDGGQARLTRDGNDLNLSASLIALGARSYVSSIEVTAQTSFATNVSHFGMTFEDLPASDIASQSPALAWLEILQAPISGSLRASTDGQGVLGPTSVALQIGAGALQPDNEVKPIPFDSAHTYLSFDPKSQTLTLDEFSLQAGWVGARAFGTAYLRKMDSGLPQEMIVQLEFSQLDLNPNNLADSPIALDNAFADVRLQINPFELTVGQLVLSQKGQRLNLKGWLAPQNDVWDYKVDGSMTSLNLDAALGAWPERFKPKLRNWISKNIHSIALKDINVALRSKGAEPPDVYLDFLFSDLNLKFMKNMPILRAGQGVASFMRNRFLVGAESGYVTADQGGDIDISGTGFVVHNTRLKESPATVRLSAKGPVTAALSLLNRKPLSVMDKAKLPVDLAKGSVRGVGTIDLTLKQKVKPEDVIFAVDLVVPQVETSHFIKDKVIAGALTGTVNNKEIVIDGDVTVGRLPVQARWRSKIGPNSGGKSAITGTAELSQLAVDEFDVGFPDGTFSGKALADFRMEMMRGVPPTLTLNSDIEGLGVSFPPLGYAKPKNSTGRATMDMTVSSPPSIDEFTFQAPGLSVDGSVAMRPKGGLDRVKLNAFEVGDWLNGTGEIRSRGEGIAPEINLFSGRFDVRGLPSGDGSESGASTSGGGLGPISANLERVQITDTYYLSNFKGRFEDKGGFGGDFTGLFNGQAPIAGQMVSQKKGQAFKITSDQGGQVISAMGITKSSGQGDLVLHLSPGAQEGHFSGNVTILNVRIQEAPAFAELLNAVSVIGLLDQLNGPGILLTEIAGSFLLAPNKLTITQGSAVGPAMGISLDGVMNLTTRFMNFQGAFSPVYIINSVGRVISKKGEGLIAFNYHLKGTPDSVQIAVNPLSALTPGFFREIFRAPSPDGTGPKPRTRSLEDETEGSQDPDAR
ncbi:Protein of unknown function [Shimia gijangensis]|uniref:AsmA-like C-terminal region n=1 Tax=Shimia gijangensis TaxID=1470563 RepID=A0A1M6ELA7_9RHOB|nr:AsmA-like C-terminal region-containing protein [Shimia gijangensis]SHI86224.1 Protein of unknown function [Shimia gijangensis]